jgi:hypothetical protein
MKIWLVTLGLALLSSEALAIERYTSTRMTCDEIQRVIRRDGAAIMRYTSTRTPGLQLYGRYVSGNQFCQLGEGVDRAYIPASDTRSCPVRECVQLDYDDPFLIIPGR